jgi:UDP-glucose 4-epimerase
VNILATGGAGLIGSHVVEVLLEKSAVVTAFGDLSSGKRENLATAAIMAMFDPEEK